MNGLFVDGEFRPSPTVHLGVAISLRQGSLLAPCLHGVEALELDDVMAQMKDLVARTRTGRLRSSEMADSTLTVTNLGEQRVDAVFGVIHPPKVALVGVGRILERPVAIDGLLGVRPLLSVTLAADHRVSDGLRGARLLRKIDQLRQHREGAVTRDHASALLTTILGEIAPEIDLACVDFDASLRDELGLDSVDFLHLIEAIYARTGVDIPEPGYWRLSSINACITHLEAAAR